jgi:ribose 5-phosphate isomerase A
MDNLRPRSDDPRIAVLKRAAAKAAVAEIEAGMKVGLGTGTTAAFAIEALARRLADGLTCKALATSENTADHARKAGISLLNFDDVTDIDLCIDGVDEIDPDFRAIKGAGGAMLREKIVASAAKRVIAIADLSKRVDRLGARPLPVEVLPFARAFVERRLAELGCNPILRLEDRRRPLRTDQGNIIFDCHFAVLGDLALLDGRLSSIPGVMGHGLFLSQIDALYLGTSEGVVRAERRITEI